MQDIMNTAKCYDYNWEKQIQDYKYDKTHLAWEKNKIPDKITTKMVKENDVVFNPIIQKYNNKDFERNLKRKEKSAIYDNIIKNEDNQLKIEQTFDIINLQDRLKGFEKDPNYPKQKDLINKRKKIDYYGKDYNIISNLPVSIHHFDKPENRPKCATSQQKRERFEYKFGQERDFDIISTRYKRFNDEKNAIDREIQKIQTAKIFYKNNDYNPVKGVYYNQNKEQEFQEKRKEEQKNWGIENFKKMPKCAKGRSDTYNLISLKVIDPQEMAKIIQEEKDRKQRYEIKYKMDDYYHERSIKNMDKEENRKNIKASYQRYKEEDNRQYDIIDLKDRPYNQHKNVIKTGGVSEWQQIINGAGKNNTLKSKSIYKDPYDYSESGMTYDAYKKNRNKTLSSLPKIEHDKVFNQGKKRLPKCASYTAVIKPKNDNTFSCSKEKFFKEPPKNINVNSSAHEKIFGNKELTGKRNQFEFNKEKNMRNLRKNLDFETKPKK